ncbi:MAG: TetR/AcrR family transcriptional regulator [Crocinitomicaceae bacterium]|nr:TetR/AcrR family transcriptional regulator [Crocinitomicaceae bacterium]
MPRTSKQFETIRSERKEAILQAALHVFAEEGYHSASISKVSKAAGVSKGLMYNYFESKEELLKILIGSLLDEENARAVEVLRKPMNDDTLIELIKLTSEIMKKKPLQWKLYFNMINQPEVMEIVKERYSSEYALGMQKLLEYFKEKGAEDPLSELQYFSSTILGLKVSYLLDPVNFPIDEVEKRIIRTFIKE